MTGSNVVVLDNPTLLSELCGANDQNLRVLESLLDTKIHSRGNELHLEDNRAEPRNTLLRMVDEINAHLNLGQTMTPDLIKAVHMSVSDDDEDRSRLFKESSIIVPGRDQRVFPRSVAQAQYLKALDERDIVFGVGPAGTGKTYLAVAHALRDILSHKRKKLVLTRPVVEAGESLGFLPGDLAQKISPYLRPLYDAMESLASFETIRRFEDQRVIEIAPLAYMRGRSLNNCYVILDEAQNTTREQMKMFLTRLGDSSTAVITGDVTQIDLPRKQRSGLLHAVDLLSHIAGIQFCYFTAKDVVRNPLVQQIVHAYENERTDGDSKLA